MIISALSKNIRNEIQQTKAWKPTILAQKKNQ